MTPHTVRDHPTVATTASSQRSLVTSAGTSGVVTRMHHHTQEHRGPLLDSEESLSALWIARYPDSGNERKRVLGVPESNRCLTSRSRVTCKRLANTEIGTANEATTRKHDVALLAQ